MTPCLPARVDCLSTAPAPHQPGGSGRAPAPEEHATIRETGRVPGPSQPVVQRPHEEPPTAQCEPRSSPSEHLLPTRERARALRPTPVQGLLQDLRPTAVRGDPSSSQARNCVELEPRPLPRDGAGQILFGPRPSEALPKAAAVAQCPAPGLCSKEHAPSGATKARPRAETAWRDQPERPAYGLASGTRAHARNGVSPVPTSPCGAPLC